MGSLHDPHVCWEDHSLPFLVYLFIYFYLLTLQIGFKLVLPSLDPLVHTLGIPLYWTPKFKMCRTREIIWYHLKVPCSHPKSGHRTLIYAKAGTFNH